MRTRCGGLCLGEGFAQRSGLIRGQARERVGMEQMLVYDEVGDSSSGADAGRWAARRQAPLVEAEKKEAMGGDVKEGLRWWSKRRGGKGRRWSREYGACVLDSSCDDEGLSRTGTS